MRKCVLGLLECREGGWHVYDRAGVFVCVPAAT